MWERVRNWGTRVVKQAKTKKDKTYSALSYKGGVKYSIKF